MKRAWSERHGEYIVCVGYISNRSWIYVLEEELLHSAYSFVYFADEPFDSFTWEEISYDPKI